MKIGVEISQKPDGSYFSIEGGPESGPFSDDDELTNAIAAVIEEALATTISEELFNADSGQV